MIVFLAPDEEIYATATTTLAGSHPDIRIEQGLLSAGVRRAQELAAQGTEIIISRGGTAAAIKEAIPDLIVVEVPITGFDILRAVEAARRHGRHIGVVAFPSMVVGIECLPALLDVELRLYLLQNEFEAESRVIQAFREGAEVVIGGVITGKAGQKLKLPHVLIRSGAEGILQAMLEARRIAEARLLEKLKGTLFKAVLDYSYEGVVSIDTDGRAVIFNPAASRITGIQGNTALGRPIQEILPRLNLERLLQDESGRAESDHFPAWGPDSLQQIADHRQRKMFRRLWLPSRTPVKSSNGRRLSAKKSMPAAMLPPLPLPTSSVPAGPF